MDPVGSGSAVDTVRSAATVQIVSATSAVQDVPACEAADCAAGFGQIALHGKVNFALRAYVKPGSDRGADPKLQLKGRVLTFVRR